MSDKQQCIGNLSGTDKVSQSSTPIDQGIPASLEAMIAIIRDTEIDQANNLENLRT